jgi:uncharacterized protein YbcV (DUF1398 family)
MNRNILNELKDPSFAGKISFSEVIKRLIANDVERYIVDLVGFKITYFSNDGQVHESSFKLDTHEIAQEFNAIEVKSAIKNSQQAKINFQTFLKRIMLAGCTHYEVFITGEKVIYIGRDGSNHIELFPSAKP